jgi:hypothetical protein
MATLAQARNHNRPALSTRDCEKRTKVLPGQALTDLGQMLASLSPKLRPGVWVYAVLPEGMAVPECAAAVVGEAEGCTVVLREEEADALGLTPLFRGRWITLQVHSCLTAVGLTARVAAELAEQAIPCNMLAGFRHDHLLVPAERTSDAITCLNQLQSEHAAELLATTDTRLAPIAVQ